MQSRKYDPLKFLTKSNFITLQFFEHLSLALSLCLCYDVMATLRDPTKRHENRMKHYIIISLVLATLTTLFAIDRIREPNDLFGF